MFEMFREDGPRENFATAPIKRYQFSLPHAFWAMFVACLYCGYWRLLALTCDFEMRDVVLLSAPAFGSAVLLSWDPRTLLAQLAYASPFLAFLPVLLYVQFVQHESLGPTLPSYLVLCAMFAFVGGCLRRFASPGEANAAFTTLLMLIVFVTFCVGFVKVFPGF